EDHAADVVASAAEASAPAEATAAVDVGLSNVACGAGELEGALSGGERALRVLLLELVGLLHVADGLGEAGARGGADGAAAGVDEVVGAADHRVGLAHGLAEHRGRAADLLVCGAQGGEGLVDRGLGGGELAERG